MEIKERLPLGGVGAERATAVVMLSVCAISVCTGVCATLRAAAARVARIARVGGEGVWGLFLLGGGVLEKNAFFSGEVKKSNSSFLIKVVFVGRCNTRVSHNNTRNSRALLSSILDT